MKLATRIVVGLELACAVGIVAFWTQFLMMENTPARHSEVFLGFERAFIFPDLALVVPCLVLGALGLIHGQGYGRTFSLIAAANVLFISLMDIGFALQQDLYLPFTGYTILDLLLHLVMFTGSVSVLALLWADRAPAERSEKERHPATASSDREK